MKKNKKIWNLLAEKRKKSGEDGKEQADRRKIHLGMVNTDSKNALEQPLLYRYLLFT